MFTNENDSMGLQLSYSQEQLLCVLSTT